MMSRSVPLCSVRVVWASLIESMPSLDKRRLTAGSHSTLTFQLHRFYKSERFGFDCTFRPFGDFGMQCFVSGMRADLVASSAALRGALDNRQAAQKSFVRVMSINGVARLTEDTVRELLDSGRDVVVQCDVSAVAGSESVHGQVDADKEGKENEGEAVSTPKKRGRRPRVVAAEGLGKMVKAPKVSKKRLRYAGARSVVEEMTRKDANIFSEGDLLGDGQESDPTMAAAAEDINVAALATLDELAPLKPVRTRGRRSAKLEEVYGAKQQRTVLEETPGDVWFTHAKGKAVDVGEDVEVPAAYAARAARKRRGRPPKTAVADDSAAVDAVKASGLQQGRSTARVFAAGKQKKVAGRRGRHRQTGESVEELGASEAAEESTDEARAARDEVAGAELEF